MRVAANDTPANTATTTMAITAMSLIFDLIMLLARRLFSRMSILTPILQCVLGLRRGIPSSAFIGDDFATIDPNDSGSVLHQRLVMSDEYTCDSL